MQYTAKRLTELFSNGPHLP